MKRRIESAEPHTKIRLRINSFGGDAFEGITIGNYLRSVGKPIEVCVDGLAASAASVVAMCGDTISMAPNAMMMVHNASSGVYGYADEMRKEADVLDKVSKAVGQTYVARTGKSATAVKDIMDAETWMTAKECVKEGFATMVALPKPNPDPDGDDDSARFLEAARESRWMELYRNVPEHLKPETRDKKLAEQRAAEAAAAEKEERERINIRRRGAAASLTV
jgi:ATP-dependent protease ClpP protease subunit